jgi:hypothetical protein
MLNAIEKAITDHWWLLPLLMVFLSAAADSLDEPTETDGRAYRTFYRLMHLLAVNISKVRR